MRDSYVDGDVRTIVTTDRLSAFDRFLGTIPFKGQVLNEIANYWFDATSDIVPNHLLEVPDPNVVRVRECAPVPLEFVVRAYITGVTKTSLWFSYGAGARTTAGQLFGNNKDQRALDKEPLREWMAEQGFRGDGEAPRHDRRGSYRDCKPLHPARRGTDSAIVRGVGAHRSRTRRQPPPRLTAIAPTRRRMGRTPRLIHARRMNR